MQSAYANDRLVNLVPAETDMSHIAIPCYHHTVHVCSRSFIFVTELFWMPFSLAVSASQNADTRHGVFKPIPKACTGCAFTSAFVRQRCIVPDMQATGVICCCAS